MVRLRSFGVAAALGACALLVLVGSSGAAGAKLKTFGTGQVTTAANSATIILDSGEFGGVFSHSKSQSGKLLSDVVFAFTSRGDVAGGAPRFSIPVNDGAFDPNTDYAFMDAAGCGATVGDNPSNTATFVSTQNPACKVNFQGVDYANWTTFANTNPTFRTAKGFVPFIIADALPPSQTTATYVVTDILLS